MPNPGSGHLKRFFRHTAVYTIGNVLYRGASFLLLPLYTRVLSPAEYGVLELVSVTAMLFQTLLSSGIAHATLRFYFEYDRAEDRNAIISTALVGSFLFTAAGASVLCVGAPAISTFVFGTSAYALPLRIVFVAMVLEISREINLAFLRAREQSGLFVVMALLQLLVQVGANVVTVWHLHLGVVGVLAGNLVATALVWILLTSSTLRTCGWRVEWKRLRGVVAYGAPLMIASIVAALVTSGDRYLVKYYASLSSLGIYALAMKIATVPAILIVGPFTTSYGPFRFTIMKQDGAGETYARVLRYFVMIGALAMLGVSILAEDAIRVVAARDYWAAAGVVPLLLVPAILGGVTYCLQTGMYIRKQTKYLLYVVILSGAVQLLLARLLVPAFGIVGSAWANVGGTLATIAYTFVVSQRLYPVQYEFARVARVAAASAALLGAGLLIHVDWLVASVAIKLALIAAFPFALVLAGGFSREETQTVRRAIVRRREQGLGWNLSAVLKRAGVMS